jgi:hypothetical protein
VFVAAIRRCLPRATIVVDHFHVVKLANDTVAEIRRRIATQLRGRRGRASDPEYQVRNLLRRNHEDLSGKAFAKLWNTLVDLGEPGLLILKAWIAKEELRRLLALAGTGCDRNVIAHRLYRFYTWCADAGVDELERLEALLPLHTSRHEGLVRMRPKLSAPRPHHHPREAPRPASSRTVAAGTGPWLCPTWPPRWPGWNGSPVGCREPAGPPCAWP